MVVVCWAGAFAMFLPLPHQAPLTSTLTLFSSFL
jgi:hypothetical protein